MGTDIPPPTALPWCNMYVFPSLDEDTVAMMTMPDDLPAELQNLMLREVRREGAVYVCVCVCVVVVHHVHHGSYGTQHNPVGGEQRDGKESVMCNVCYVCVRVVNNNQVVG